MKPEFLTKVCFLHLSWTMFHLKEHWENGKKVPLSFTSNNGPQDVRNILEGHPQWQLPLLILCRFNILFGFAPQNQSLLNCRVIIYNTTMDKKPRGNCWKITIEKSSPRASVNKYPNPGTGLDSSVADALASLWRASSLRLVHSLRLEESSAVPNV